MAKEQKGFIIYGDIEVVVDRLSDEEAGQLLKGMVTYFNTGAEPDFDGILEFVFIPIKQQMDRDKEKYEAKCEKNREKIQKYWDSVKSNTTEYSSIPMYTNATNTNTDTNTNTKTDTNTDTESVPDVSSLSSFLVGYLNEKTGSQYAVDSSVTSRISGLLASGYSPDQLRTVIDKKVDEWYGDSKMRSYLRPSTLFGDKFSEYLAAPMSVTAEKQQKANLERASLEDQLNEKRKALAYMKDSLKEATKEERRNLREQIAILEDSIGVIEGRLS